MQFPGTTVTTGTTDMITMQINELSSQFTKQISGLKTQFSTLVSSGSFSFENIYATIGRLIPLVFLIIIFWIKKKYGNTTGVYYIIQILLIIFILYFAFYFAMGNPSELLTSTTFQGTTITLVGSYLISNNYLVPGEDLSAIIATLLAPAPSPDQPTPASPVPA